MEYSTPSNAASAHRAAKRKGLIAEMQVYLDYAAVVIVLLP